MLEIPYSKHVKHKFNVVGAITLLTLNIDVKNILIFPEGETSNFYSQYSLKGNLAAFQQAGSIQCISTEIHIKEWTAIERFCLE